MVEDKSSRIDVTRDDLAKGVVIRPGTTKVLVVHRDTLLVDVLEVHDSLFRAQSALMLPCGIPKQEKEGVNGHSYAAMCIDDAVHCFAIGLAAIKGMFRYWSMSVDRQQHKKMLITGHTDTVGSDNDNADLSLMRAQVVRDIILGDKESRDHFATTVDENHAPEDQQHVLKWIAETFAWPDADPVMVDGIFRWRTVNAVIAFKRSLKNTYQQRFPPKTHRDILWPKDMSELICSVQDDATVDVTIWKIIFEFYQVEIKRYLLEYGIDIVDIRESLNWADNQKRAVGCGETWPIDARGADNYKSQSNRRVEILFYDPKFLRRKKMPCKNSACHKEDCHIYRKINGYDPQCSGLEPKFEWKYVNFDENGNPARIVIVDIHIESSKVSSGKAIATLLTDYDNGGTYRQSIDILNDSKSEQISDGYYRLSYTDVFSLSSPYSLVVRIEADDSKSNVDQILFQNIVFNLDNFVNNHDADWEKEQHITTEKCDINSEEDLFSGECDQSATIAS